MAHYGSNVDGKLYKGNSTAVPLIAVGTDVLVELPLLESVTPPANELQSSSFNVLNQAAPLNLGGKLAVQTVDAVLALDWTSTLITDMYTDSVTAGGRRRNWKLLYPTGRFMTFQGFVTKWAEEALDAGEDIVEHRVAITITLVTTPVITP